MKKKIQVGGLKIKVSWKNSRLVKAFNNFFKGQSYTLKPATIIHPEKLREQKIYRLFKEQYCEFKPGYKYGEHKIQPSSLIYYKGCTTLGCERCLIGELMFEEDKKDFFKRKNILIQEDIHYYNIVQSDELLAQFDKEWVEAQGQYQ